MSARDDFGSSAGRGGGLNGGRGPASAGGLQNGGVGGGFGGGAPGGGWGAGLNGGARSQTGVTTGTVMRGIAGRNGLTFSGRPGGFAQQPGAWGQMPQASVQSSPLTRPAQPRVPGLLDNPPAVPTIEDVPMPVYDPLASIQPPAVPTPPQIGLPINPDLLQRAVATPRRAVNVAGALAPERTTYNFGSGFANSVYGNPQLGMPSAGGAGLGSYGSYAQGSATGGKTNLGGAGGMSTWR